CAGSPSSSTAPRHRRSRRRHCGSRWCTAPATRAPSPRCSPVCPRAPTCGCGRSTWPCRGWRPPASDRGCGSCCSTGCSPAPPTTGRGPCSPTTTCGSCAARWARRRRCAAPRPWTSGSPRTPGTATSATTTRGGGWARWSARCGSSSRDPWCCSAPRRGRGCCPCPRTSGWAGAWSTAGRRCAATGCAWASWTPSRCGTSPPPARVTTRRRRAPSGTGCVASRGTARSPRSCGRPRCGAWIRAQRVPLHHGFPG
ncbi:MAG: hypothetical protein AVDCRST_MAG66-4335, partial [uncultured Pseudonocardia sp.]